LFAHPSVALHAYADDMDRELVGLGVEALAEGAGITAAGLLTIGEQDNHPGLFSKIEHLGRFCYGRSERRLPGGDQGIDDTQDTRG
jgi:hypothetical protein